MKAVELWPVNSKFLILTCMIYTNKTQLDWNYTLICTYTILCRRGIQLSELHGKLYSMREFGLNTTVTFFSWRTWPDWRKYRRTRTWNKFLESLSGFKAGNSRQHCRLSICSYYGWRWQILKREGLSGALYLFLDLIAQPWLFIAFHQLCLLQNQLCWKLGLLLRMNYQLGMSGMEEEKK